jgi:uncharacterized membrane protein YsdA (DUF1294 family)
MQKFLLIYFLLINSLTFIAFIVDKIKAVRQQWRIRENYLLILSTAGGLPAAWSAMFLVRHKIKDSSFLPKIICITIIWIIGIIVFLKK